MFVDSNQVAVLTQKAGSIYSRLGLHKFSSAGPFLQEEGSWLCHVGFVLHVLTDGS